MIKENEGSKRQDKATSLIEEMKFLMAKKGLFPDDYEFRIGTERDLGVGNYSTFGVLKIKPDGSGVFIPVE